jgi:two-component system sensor histidine kinase KdpD
MAEQQRPDPLQILRQISSETRRRVLFRVYLGYARGAGTTTVMLDEARRRSGRGTDVVVASYGVHGKPDAALRDLEVLGARRHPPAGQALDVEKVLARNPEVVCIDDLAELEPDGRPRIEAVARLLAAGITVLATLHLLSIKSTATAFGVMLGSGPPGALIEDAALEAIDELELVDVTPADLLQRLREQGLLAPAELAVALQRELRLTVLEALRESAFRVIAEHADRQLVGYMRATGVMVPWEVRGRIVLALPVGRGLEGRIQRAGAYAQAQNAQFSVVSVRPPNLSDEEKEWLGAYVTLTHKLGGEFVHLRGRSVAAALVEYIRESLATELILGHRRRTRWLPGDTTSEVIRRLSGVDVHILRSEPGSALTRPPEASLRAGSGSRSDWVFPGPSALDHGLDCAAGSCGQPRSSGEGIGLNRRCGDAKGKAADGMGPGSPWSVG